MNTWHDLTSDETLHNLDTNTDGLSDSDVQSRREKYGRNKLKEPEKKSEYSGFSLNTTTR